MHIILRNVSNFYLHSDCKVKFVIRHIVIRQESEKYPLKSRRKFKIFKLRKSTTSFKGKIGCNPQSPVELTCTFL